MTLKDKSEVKKFEHKHESLNTWPKMMKRCDELSEEGWELVSSHYDHCIFRRELK